MNEDPSRKYMPMITEKETKYRQALERIRDLSFHSLDLTTDKAMRQIAREALEEEPVNAKVYHSTTCPKWMLSGCCYLSPNAAPG